MESRSAETRIEKLYLVFFILIIVEGAIRKWLFHGAGVAFIFIRDPIALLIYGTYFFKTRLSQGWVIYWGFGVVGFAGLALIQALTESVSPFVILIGFRYYLYFMPIAFIAGQSVSEQAFYKWVRLTIWCALPISVLVILQFYSPVGSILNAGTADSANELIFTVVYGVVRPYGPFSFTAGQGYFSDLSVCVSLIVLCERKKANVSFGLAVGMLVASLTMVALSGSRGTYIFSVPPILCFLAGELLAGRSRKVVWILGVSPVIIFIFLAILFVVFPQAALTMAERQQDAIAGEGATQYRMIFIATEFISVLTDTPLFGYGVGAGTNAGSFLALGEAGFLLHEYEWTRLTEELGPIIGPFIIFLRISATTYLGYLAIKKARRGSSIALILFGFVGPLLLIGQFTTQNTILALNWFCLGMMLVALKFKPNNSPRKLNAYKGALAGIV